MVDPWIEAEKSCLPSILEDLEREIYEDFHWLLHYMRSEFEETATIAAKILIRRGRQYLALKRRLQFD
jgi:hypothetical protein